VTENRNRWFINVVLVLAVIGLVGFSLVPIFNGILESSKAPATTSPSPTESGRSAPKKEELAAQAKGYELVLQREPENQTALRGLIEARLGLADIKGVIDPLEKLVKLNPNATEYAVLLAQAKQQVGDREGSIQTYRKVLELNPGNINALDGLVTLLLQQNRPEAAIGLLQDTLKTAPQANKIQPGSVDATSVRLLLGKVYADQKRYTEAIALYDDAATNDKQDFRPILAKAIVLKAQGKTEESKPLFTKAFELAPARFKDQINQMAASSLTPGAPAPSQTPTSSQSATPSSPAPAPTTSP
jgi:tetratricopeptide (TPR) repeat protein